MTAMFSLLPNAFDENGVISPEQLELHAVQVLRELLPGILHELNNPLSYLLGNIESLHEYVAFLSQGARLLLEYPTTAKHNAPTPSSLHSWSQASRHWKQQENVEYLLGDVDEIMRDMMAGVEIWSSLAESLRLYLRKPRSSFESFDLAAVLEHSILLVQHLGQKKIEFHRDIQPCDPCWGSPVLTCRMLVYLLLNAIEAVQHKSQARIEIQLSQTQESLLLTLQDNGCGMTEEPINTAKQPGISSGASSHRTGLGLSIAKQIMILHQGQLQSQSVPKQKTVVSLWFPRNTSRKEQDIA